MRKLILLSVLAIAAAAPVCASADSSPATPLPFCAYNEPWSWRRRNRKDHAAAARRFPSARNRSSRGSCRRSTQRAPRQRHRLPRQLRPVETACQHDRHARLRPCPLRQDADDQRRVHDRVLPGHGCEPIRTQRRRRRRAWRLPASRRRHRTAQGPTNEQLLLGDHYVAALTDGVDPMGRRAQVAEPRIEVVSFGGGFTEGCGGSWKSLFCYDRADGLNSSYLLPNGKRGEVVERWANREWTSAAQPPHRQPLGGPPCEPARIRGLVARSAISVAQLRSFCLACANSSSLRTP